MGGVVMWICSSEQCVWLWGDLTPPRTGAPLSLPQKSRQGEGDDTLMDAKGNEWTRVMGGVLTGRDWRDRILNEYSFKLLNRYSSMSDIDPIEAQRIAARRAQILDAAAAVFAEKGFHKTTIRDVARQAGIADGTIYNYFQDKDALLLGLLDRLNETPEREKDFEQASRIDFEDWVRGYLKQRGEFLTQGGGETFRAILSELLVNPALRDRYREQVVEPTYALSETFVRQWIAEGKLKAIDPQLGTRVISGLFLGILIERLLSDEVLIGRWDEAIDMLAGIVLRGLAPGDEPE